MSRSSDFRSGRHVIFELTACLVFMPKYRKPCITPRVAAELREAFTAVCDDFGCDPREFAHESDHVCLVVAYPPKVAIARLVNSLKGVSARRLGALEWPEIERATVGGAFWSPSYGAFSCGRSFAERARRYVEMQRRSSA